MNGIDRQYEDTVFGNVKVTLDPNMYDPRDAHPVYRALSQEVNQEVDLAFCIEDLKEMGINVDTPGQADVPKILQVCKARGVDPSRFGIKVQGYTPKPVDTMADINQVIMADEKRKDDIAGLMLSGNKSMKPMLNVEFDILEEEKVSDDNFGIDDDDLTRSIMKLI